MDRLLAKYIYKNYYLLLRDEDFNLAISRLGWVRPAVIPHQRALFHNRLIRKYLVYKLKDLLDDVEFQKILCHAGYYGPACTTTTSTTTSTTSSTTSTTTSTSTSTTTSTSTSTTTSTSTSTTTSTTSSTTTTTTTAAPIENDILFTNNTNDPSGSIDNATWDGSPIPGTTFPLGSTSSTGGTISAGTGTVAVTVSGNAGNITVLDSNENTQCQNYTTPGTYTFPGVVYNGTETVSVILNIQGNSCP